MLMKKTALFCLSLAICFLLQGVGAQTGMSSAVAIGIPSTQAAPKKDKETTYDRVMRTGKIRCGYVVYPPALVMDPNTRVLSGIYPDILEKVSALLNLDIEWTEEVSWATLSEGLLTGRYDLFCSAAWPNGPRSRVVAFSHPLYFSGIDVYLRSDEDRFQSHDDLNRKDLRFSVIDGSTIYFMTKEFFPKASLHSLPEMSSHAEMILDVGLKKADAVLAERSAAYDFMRHNPDMIKPFEATVPLVANANSFVFDRDQYAFASMINGAVDILQNQGVINKILKKYEPADDFFFYRVARPYAAPGE